MTLATQYTKHVAVRDCYGCLGTGKIQGFGRSHGRACPCVADCLLCGADIAWEHDDESPPRHCDACEALIDAEDMFHEHARAGLKIQDPWLTARLLETHAVRLRFQGQLDSANRAAELAHAIELGYLNLAAVELYRSGENGIACLFTRWTEI